MHAFRMIIVLLLCTLMGCTTYHPRPLNTEDLNKALATPDKKQIAKQATLLNHPRIPPSRIDFSKGTRRFSCFNKSRFESIKS